MITTMTKTTATTAPAMVAIPPPGGESVPPCEAVPPVGVSGDVAGVVVSVGGGDCVTTVPVKEKRLIGHCY